MRYCLKAGLGNPLAQTCNLSFPAEEEESTTFLVCRFGIQIKAINSWCNAFSKSCINLSTAKSCSASNETWTGLKWKGLHHRDAELPLSGHPAPHWREDPLRQSVISHGTQRAGSHFPWCVHSETLGCAAIRWCGSKILSSKLCPLQSIQRARERHWVVLESSRWWCFVEDETALVAVGGTTLRLRVTVAALGLLFAGSTWCMERGGNAGQQQRCQ